MRIDCIPFVLAPGTYMPEKVVLDHSPAYSFGAKTAIEKVNDTPAPGTYKPEQVILDHPPAYSFGIKHSQHRSVIMSTRT